MGARSTAWPSMLDTVVRGTPYILASSVLLVIPLRYVLIISRFSSIVKHLRIAPSRDDICDGSCSLVIPQPLKPRTRCTAYLGDANETWLAPSPRSWSLLIFPHLSLY
jgi:hypothetical protein